MPGLNEINNRIASVESTRKITRAMYLMSASKSKKAKKQMEAMLPYFRHSAEVMTEILAASGQVDSPFFHIKEGTEGHEDLYIVLAADKGMAGGYNSNLLNLLKAQVADRHKNMFWVAGMMGRMQMNRHGYPIQADFKYPVMNPNLYRARDMAELVIERYKSGEFRKVYLVYTSMVTALKLEPTFVQLLPLKPEDFLPPGDVVGGDDPVDYEPGPEEVFDILVPHYLKGVIYCALVEAFTSEQNARMFAMDNATNSANDMIAQLSQRYNRARQARITQEINEIAGGVQVE
ncbi:MAG: ATP synthase F1 subunit gamma [Lachnospiraceae bacterium]|jgi:F-type H+-transporting ATPase subunit gamma|nr:ATP synthase F1 subunit gamma [Lachnospiraceae bacterium]